MDELHIIGIDLAKHVFQVHGSDKSGHVLFRKKLSRPQFAKFLTEIPVCIIAMEACSTAHHWAEKLRPSASKCCWYQPADLLNVSSRS